MKKFCQFPHFDTDVEAYSTVTIVVEGTEARVHACYKHSAYGTNPTKITQPPEKYLVLSFFSSPKSTVSEQLTKRCGDSYEVVSMASVGNYYTFTLKYTGPT